MALIEKIRIRPFNNIIQSAVIDPAILEGDFEAASHSISHAVAAAGLPGLRIHSRLTTSSFSDYSTFDLRQITGGEQSALITDGAAG